MYNGQDSISMALNLRGFREIEKDSENKTPFAKIFTAMTISSWQEIDCRVCRHIFADRLYVEEYKASDFYREVGLDRQKLIYLALLLGSDYTEGISGIGIVNAVSLALA